MCEEKKKSQGTKTLEGGTGGASLQKVAQLRMNNQPCY